MDYQSPPPQQPQYPQPQYQQPPQKPGTPVWVWVIVGCCGGGILMVAVLAAIMFPVIAQQRESRRKISCQSNMKQMSLAVSMYMQDYDEVLPRSVQWMDDLQPYIKQEGVFHCPTVAEGKTDSSAPHGYAYNSAMSSKPMASIDLPASTVDLYDSSNLGRNISDPVSSQPSPPRHVGGNNIGYTDGHVKWNGTSSTGSSSGF